MSHKGLPHFAKGEVVKGFGRGSKELGCPTANFPVDVVKELPPDIDTGIYYGFASVDRGDVHKMVLSIGWNPFYKNETKSMETHILHEFDYDFYGKELRVIMLGYLRPEKDFSSLDELKKQIADDITNARKELAREDLAQYRAHSYFTK